MKYDGEKMSECVAYPIESVIKAKKKKSKFNILDIFVVQSALCVMISVAVLIAKYIGLN